MAEEMNIKEIRKKISEEVEKEFVNTANEWSSCFITQLTILSVNLQKKFKEGKIEKRLGDRMKELLENLTVKVRELQKEYPNKEVLPPKDDRDVLINRLSMIKMVVESKNDA